jgi:hypothetical protein
VHAIEHRFTRSRFGSREARSGIMTEGKIRRERPELQAVEAKAADAAGGADKIKSEIEVSSKRGGEKPSAVKNDQQ